MSCEIKAITNILDIELVHRALLFTDFSKDSDWLNSCLISISPTGELLAVSYESKLLILASKWDSEESRNLYALSWSGVLDPPHHITALLCLPITAQGQSSQVGADWTCIAVGFSSGYCKFYTESAGLILSERFHDDPVVHLKCQTSNGPCPGSSGDSPVGEDEFYVCYKSNICVAPATALVQILRSNRLQLARSQAKGIDTEFPNNSLTFRKWGFSEQAVVRDASVVGLERSNMFDHLLTASTVGGFHSRYRATAPQNTLVLAAGAKPYLGFHFALEGGAQPILSDVAKAVASKIKSALPGWLTGVKAAPQTQDAPPVPVEPMSCRFGLCDLQRHADTITLSPNKTLSVVTDTLGRVILVDVHRGIALRVWKGYRGAQCAFLQVLEETQTRKSRHTRCRAAQFLVIYAPKKGLLEIWVLQQGPKLATFSASKHGRLLYTPYGLVGFMGKTNQHCQFPCLFIDPDGTMKEIIVPFHYAVSDKNSKRARDVHLIKRLKLFLKANEFDSDTLKEEVVNTCKELKTNEMITQYINVLVSAKNMQPEALLGAVNELMGTVSSNSEGDDFQVLQNMCYKIHCLITFFLYVTKPNKEGIQNGDVDIQEDRDDEICDIKNVQVKNLLDTQLQISEQEMSNLQRLLDLATSKDNKQMQQMKVKFHEDKKPIFYEFISSFTISKDIDLKRCKPETMYILAEALFSPFIVNDRDIVYWIDEARSSKIPPECLVKLLLVYWLNRPLIKYKYLETEMYRFSRILYQVCLMMGLDSICVEFNEVSPWWQNIRNILTESRCPFRGLMAAILCRIVAHKAERTRELQSLAEEDNCVEVWERVSGDNLQWSILIGKLDDVSLLSVVLSNKPVVDEPLLPKLEYDVVDISLKYILQAGRGVVSELVGRWLTAAGVGSQELIVSVASGANQTGMKDDNKPSTPKTMPDIDSAVEEEQTIQDKPNIEPIFKQLTLLGKHFPFSLEPSIILLNMAWEYSAYWHKNIHELHILEACLSCIESIPNPHIKQGVCALAWSTHVKHKFECACILINKAGKVPKERICQQELGLSNVPLTKFLEVCIKYMDVYMESIQQSYDSEKFNLKHEELWDNGPIPLSQLAMQQPHSNYEVIMLHYQLACALHMLARFNIKQSKPIYHFFDYVGQQALFCDMESRPQLPSHAPDSRVINSRTSFLTKVITCTIELIQSEEDVIYCTEASRWMTKAEDLGAIWGIEQLALRKHQIIELYRHGFDSLAEEKLGSVADLEGLGSMLLEVAGRRLMFHIQQAPDLKNKMAALGPALTAYLDTLANGNDNTDNGGCAGSVAAHALHCLAETPSTDRRIAGLMVDACCTLQL